MNATPRPVAAILDSPVLGLLMRIVLTLPFWGSGLSKLLDFGGAQAEMEMFGLHPTAPFAIA